MLIGEGGASVLFEQEGFAGLKSERRKARRGAGLKSPRAETGQVETQVVLVAGDFDGDGAAVAAGEFAAAREALVGAFKCFYCQHCAVLDDDGLANLQAG